MNSDEIIHQQQEQNKLLLAKLVESELRCEQYSQAYTSLQNQLNELLRHRFGKKSERFIDPENPQGSLFEDDSFFKNAESKSKALPELAIAGYTRSNKNTKSKKELPHRIVIIPVAEKDRQCACGAEKQCIRYETKCLLHYVPEVLECSYNVVK